MKKEKAVQTAATVKDGMEQMRLDLEAPIKLDYTPEPGTIASILMTGQRNALTAKEISNITGLPFRAVTMRILKERREGAPIMSSTDRGYWIAEDAEELLRCVNALHRRAKTIHATAAALKRIVRR